MKYTVIGSDKQCRLAAMCRLAKAHGGACLSKHFVSTKAKLHWRCAEGHEWRAIPESVIRNHWCMICGNERQGRLKAHTIDMMHKVAASRGGKCLSQSYRNTLAKLRWRCRHGHEWEATARGILGTRKRKGSWCPICAGKLSPKQAVEQLQSIASKKGGVLLSKRYKDAKSHLRWQCGKGHQWKAIPDAIRRGGWCPVCAGTRLLSLKLMQTAAERYGGKCISTRYENIDTPLRWRCAEGHEWEAKPYHVRTGHWCPVCSQGVSERICRAILERVTGAEFPKQRPAWLKNDRGNQMELDGYAENLGVGFEYHGPQHYRELPFFHRGEKHLTQRRRDDAQKRKLCHQQGVALIEVPHDVPHQGLQQYLTKALDKLGRTRNLVHSRDIIDIRHLDVWNQKRVEEMQSIATVRGGQCLSDFYINNNTKLRWRCGEGHEWEAVPGSIKSGAWCAKCGDKEAARKRAHTIQYIQRLAATRGGQCLSSIYKSSKDRLRWRCAKGHEWEAQANHVIAGHWCPRCGFDKLARLYALSIEDMKAAAEKRGGMCLSEKYENQRSRLRWRCAHGHEWEAVTMSIRRGSWCPVCAGRRAA